MKGKRRKADRAAPSAPIPTAPAPPPVQPPWNRQDSTRQWLIAGGLMLATLLAYLPAVHGDFIWDDDTHITGNQALKTMHGLWDIWFKPGATCQYYPLSFTGFWLGYHLWGLHPEGFHLLNIFLHGTAAILLWRVFRALKVPGAWLAGAIFALHPVCVMSVAWMTELKNTLSGSLALGAAWAYVRAAGLGVYAHKSLGAPGPLDSLSPSGGEVQG